MSRESGTVKWFSNPKGYGFISLDDGREIFVHYTAIEGTGYRSLEEGEVVEFEVVDSDRGLKAENVTRVGEEEEAASAS